MEAKTLKDYNRIIEAAKLAKSLTINRSAFKKKLSNFLEVKGNEFKLWSSLSSLSEYGMELLGKDVELKQVDDNGSHQRCDIRA
jgi:hypothetical protein